MPGEKKKRKASAYSLRVGALMKQGKSMKEAHRLAKGAKKKSGPKRKPGGVGHKKSRRSSGGLSRKSGGHMHKRPSLSKMALVGGALVAVTGVGVSAKEEIVDAVQSGVDTVSDGHNVSGTSIVVGTVALAAGCTLMPGVGYKVRGFLGRYGLRP